MANVIDEKIQNDRQTFANGPRTPEAPLAAPRLWRTNGPSRTDDERGLILMPRYVKHPPLLCDQCEIDERVYEVRHAEWKAWKKSKNKVRIMREPSYPVPCGEGAAVGPCCGEPFRCGTRHGHPTEQEEKALKDSWDRLMWGPPDEHFGRGIRYRGYPEALCVICDGMASEWIGNDKPVCRECFKELIELRAGVLA